MREVQGRYVGVGLTLYCVMSVSTHVVSEVTTWLGLGSGLGLGLASCEGRGHLLVDGGERARHDRREDEHARGGHLLRLRARVRVMARPTRTLTRALS